MLFGSVWTKPKPAYWRLSFNPQFHSAPCCNVWPWLFLSHACLLALIPSFIQWVSRCSYELFSCFVCSWKWKVTGSLHRLSHFWKLTRFQTSCLVGSATWHSFSLKQKMCLLCTDREKSCFRASHCFLLSFYFKVWRHIHPVWRAFLNSYILCVVTGRLKLKKVTLESDLRWMWFEIWILILSDNIRSETTWSGQACGGCREREGGA